MKTLCKKSFGVFLAVLMLLSAVGVGSYSVFAANTNTEKSGQPLQAVTQCISKTLVIGQRLTLTCGMMVKAMQTTKLGQVRL